MLLVVAVLGVSYASSVRAWLQQRSDIHTYAAQVAASRTDIASLTQMKQRLHDPAYLHTQARERFGWLMPGQTGYRVIDASGRMWKTAGQLAPPTPATAATHQEWWDRAWKSVVAAGGTPGASASERAFHRRHQAHVVEHIGKLPKYRPPPGRTPHEWFMPDSSQGVPGR